MIGFLATLLGSRVGRYLVIGGLIAAGVSIVLLRVFLLGKKSEKLKEQQKRLEDLQTKVVVHDEIVSMAPDERRTQLERWMRD